MRPLRLLLAYAAVGFPAPAAGAQAPKSALVQASIEPAGDLWVGQRVTLVVVLKTPGFFANAPAFELPQVSGVILMAPEDRPVIGSETIQGASYTTQRHELSAYPQRAGRVTLPGFPVRFESSLAYGQPVIPQRVVTPAVTFEAKRPPGTEALSTVITTSELTAKETWDPEPSPKEIKPGAAFTRTITVEAHDIPGMVLPSFHTIPPPGVAAYPKPPVIADRTERGEFTGRRVETTTFVCQEPGTFSLPALALAWWDPAEPTLHKVTLPGRTFQVITPPPAAQQLPPSSSPSHSWAFGVVATASLLALAVLAWRSGPTVLAWWKRRLLILIRSEPAVFFAFIRACRRNDPRAAYRTLLTWLARFLPTDPAPTAEDFSTCAADPALTSELTALQWAVYGPASSDHPPWNGAALARQARRARSRLHRQQRRHRRPIRGLPPLNGT